MSLIAKESAGGLKQAPANETADPAETAIPGVPAPAHETPFIVIEPKKSWALVNPADLWNFRELLYFLTWRDIKVRYKQTLLGVAWVVVQPLATMLVFTLLFGRLAGLEERTGGIPYAIFAFAGLLPWTFFAGAVNAGGNSLVNNSNLLTKVYFPRVIVPVAAAGALLVDFLLSAVFLAGLMVYYGVPPSWKLLMLPVLAALTALLAVATGTLLAALNVKYRDIRHALPFLLQMWMFGSPVIYPTTMVPEPWRRLLTLNPMSGIIEGFRASLFESYSFDGRALAAAVVVTLALVAAAAHTFRRMEKEFADIV